MENGSVLKACLLSEGNDPEEKNTLMTEKRKVTVCPHDALEVR